MIIDMIEQSCIDLNKFFDILLDISPKTFVFFKTFYSEISYIELWFINQNFKLLDVEDKRNITLVIN